MTYQIFKPLPDLPAPLGEVGLLSWVRHNFFKNIYSSILTLFGIYLIYRIAGPMVSWFVIDAVYIGDSDVCTAASGACWSFISANLELFLFGPYPRDLLWRPILAGALLAVIFGITVFRLISVRNMVIGWTGLVFVSYWLFAGGLGLEVVSTTKWGGLMLTLMLSVVGIFVSVPLGILLALGRRSNFSPLRFLSIVIIEGIRGIPLVTILFMATVLLPLFFSDGVQFNKIFRVQIGMIIFSSAYIAEVVRGGLQGVDGGQKEAADSLGLSGWRSTYHIILPQALANVLSPLIGRCIALLKDTSLVIVVGLLDFLGIAKAASQNAEWLGFEAEAFVFCAAIYWMLCFGLSRYGRSLEKIGSAKKH